ncbi:MCE family protein [Aeromicrobium sp.]|uniref:MCE family protein n=1 Tax=Aeromicrobium sp. TaxID=1871063 RepID=UPI0030BB65EB
MSTFDERRARRIRRLGLGGGVFLVVMALLLAYISTTSIGKSSYTAYLEHTAGLRVGESVQVAGVAVGKVTDVKLRGRQVEVGFTVDSDIRLGNKTTAGVKVLTLLGTHYLGVTPEGGGTLLDDTIPRSRTSVPYNLQDVVEAAGETLEALDSETLAKSMTVMADALRGTSVSGRRALVGVSRLSKIAADRSGEMRALLSSTRTVTGKLAANRQDIIKLMEESNLILDELVSRRDAIHQMLIDSRRLAEAISDVISDNKTELTSMMKNFKSTLRLLQEHDKSLTDSIDGLATTSIYFANATGNGPWLDVHVPSLIPDSFTCVNPTGGCE